MVTIVFVVAALAAASAAVDVRIAAAADAIFLENWL